MIPKKRKGRWRALGIPCIRDRAVQTSALLVWSPVFEADRPAEQYACRSGCRGKDAIVHLHQPTNTGHHEVVDADLSNYFGEIPHVEVMQSLARRVSDGAMLKLIRSWLMMPVEKVDSNEGKRRTN